MKIICGTDFSPEAREVATISARIASTGNIAGSVSLTHVAERKKASRRAPKSGEPHASAAKQIAGEAKRLRTLNPVVSTQLLDANEEQTLLDADPDGQADIVVLPALSGGASERFPLGQNCELLLESSPLPLLIVRSTQPMQDWLQGARPLRIMCAFDFTTSARRALAWVPRLAKRHPCEIIVAHVTDTAAHAADVGLEPHGGPRGLEPTPEELLEAEIVRRVDRVFGGLAYRVLVSDHLGDPGARLRHLADREGADLIIIGSHQRTRGEQVLSASLSLEIARNCSQSVLVVPLSARVLVEHFPPIERMLIATDLSPGCNAAARRAIAMAPPNAEIVLVTVLHPRELPNREFVRDTSDPRFVAGHADWMERSHQALSQLLPADADESLVRAEVVEDEEIAEGIRRAANRLDASVVCLGTMGRTGLRALVLGSIAQDVLSIIKRPILLIPPEAP